MRAFARCLSGKRLPNTTHGRRKLITWLRKHKVDRAVMEASGGYERDWAKTLREAGLLARIVDPKRVRNFARSAGRLAKNDAIDAEMIAWFAETFGEATCQVYDAEREKLVQIMMRVRPDRCADRVAKQGRKSRNRFGPTGKSVLAPRSWL